MNVLGSLGTFVSSALDFNKVRVEPHPVPRAAAAAPLQHAP